MTERQQMILGVAERILVARFERSIALTPQMISEAASQALALVTEVEAIHTDSDIALSERTARAMQSIVPRTKGYDGPPETGGYHAHL